MEKIHAKIACQQNKMKLYMEVADRPIYGEVHNCNMVSSDFFLKKN